MIRVALKGLAQRRLRLVLTALAIVLGVAMVTGSFVLTDSITRAFDSIFASAYRDTDAVVSARPLVDGSASGATLSPDVLARVRALPDVEAAAGTLIDLTGDSTLATLIDRDGTPIQNGGNPTLGLGIDPSQPRFNPLRLRDGRWASGRHEVVIDAETASSKGYAVGDPIGVAANGPVERFTITGIATYGDVSTLGGATIAAFSVPTARAVLGVEGFTTISVAARDGVADATLLGELRSLVPSADVRTGAEQAARDGKEVEGFLSFVRGFLLAFGGVALLVGAFVIANTLSITVAQRTRELATLRTLGATRRQVLRSVVVESAALGIVASAVGLGAGIGLARGLTTLLDTIGLALPATSPVYEPRTFVVPLVVGVVITVLAGLVPAVRATRVPAIAAVREGSLVPIRRRRPWAGLAVAAGGGALLAYAAVGGEIASARGLLALALGALLLVVGVAASASAAVAAIVRVVGFPARRLGGLPGALASDNAVRNPGRTAATAAALMIGLTLVTFVAVLGSSVGRSLDRGLERQLGAAWVVSASDGDGPFAVGAGDAVASAPGVTAATSIRSDRGRIGEAEVTVNGIDPATLGDLFRIEWRQGGPAVLARLGSGGAIVKQAFARANGLAVGDRFTLTAADGTSRQLTVAGTYQPPRIAELLGGVLIDQGVFDATFPRPTNVLTLVRGPASAAGLERALADYPGVQVQTRDAYVRTSTTFLSQLLNLLYVLLALSVVVGLLGMVSTLALSVHERTRELGMLRAVGMTRRQVRRMVRQESVLTALVGATLGLSLGVLLAAALVHALGTYGTTFSLPVAQLAAFAGIAVVAGVLAAAGPARRASRLNVLGALAVE